MAGELAVDPDKQTGTTSSYIARENKREQEQNRMRTPTASSLVVIRSNHDLNDPFATLIPTPRDVDERLLGVLEGVPMADHPGDSSTQPTGCKERKGGRIRRGVSEDTDEVDLAGECVGRREVGFGRAHADEDTLAAGLGEEDAELHA